MQLSSKTYKVIVGNKGHYGDEFFLTTFVDFKETFRIHSLGMDTLQLHWMTRAELVEWLRNAAAEIEKGE